MGESIGFETLHPSTLVVHANQHIRAQFFDTFAQGGELGATFPVAPKQNQSAHQRVAQAFAVKRRERSACDVNDQRGVGRHRAAVSTIQKLTA
jgi:hypothetical protein